MRTYEKYKDSGISWLGKVPENWEVCKVKHHYKLVTGFTPATKVAEFYDTNNGHTWITIADLKGKVVTDSTNKISDFYLNEYHQEKVKKGSLLYSFKLSVGQVAFAGKDLYTNEAIAAFQNSDKVNLKFFFYAAPLFIIHNSNINIYGAHILNQDLIKNAYTVFPPLPEQEAIANYLDKKTAEIDKIIAEREKKIELINELKYSIISRAVTKGINPHAKMKDSGIDWIGEIPEGWEICNLKRIADIYGRIGFRGYTEADIVQEGEGAITLSPSNMQNGGMDYSKLKYLSWTKYYESPEIMIQNGDVLMVKTGSSYGKCAFVSNLPFKATINPQIIVLKNLKIDGELLSWILQTPYVQFQILNTVIGSTIPTIAQEKIKNYFLVIPPHDDMATILEFIKNKIKKVEDSKKQIFSEIRLLREYKQSLISEVVTGKRKVID